MAYDLINLSGKIVYSSQTAKNIKEALEEANFNGEIIKNLNLSEANLRGIILQAALFPDANFQGSNLQLARLQGSDFRNSDFSGADFQKAELEGTNLYGANLQDSYVHEANFRSTNLAEAILINIRGLIYCKNINKAIFQQTRVDPETFQILVNMGVDAKNLIPIK